MHRLGGKMSWVYMLLTLVAVGLCEEEKKGVWRDWAAWQCTEKVRQTRTRTCPAGTGKCGEEKGAMEQQARWKCETPVNGTWSAWEGWTGCSVTCGEGWRVRVRTCSDPAPFHGGNKCEGEHYQTEQCTVAPCPVDGRWEEWSEWSECSTTCGGGKRERTRVKVPAQHNGKEVEGDAVETKKCNKMVCPEWREWSGWIKAGADDSGDRTVYRRRTCNKKGGRLACQGEEYEQQTSRDGGWSEWTPYNCRRAEGSETGKLVRYRQCTNPAPQYGGKPCMGAASEVKANSRCK